MLALVSEDIALADADNGRLVRHRKSWKVALESGGLKLNEAKIEFNSADPSPVRIVRQAHGPGQIPLICISRDQ